MADELSAMLALYASRVELRHAPLNDRVVEGGSYVLTSHETTVALQNSFDAQADLADNAAFRCILRAAPHGLKLSDCHFCNFGVQLTESTTDLSSLQSISSPQMSAATEYGQEAPLLQSTAVSANVVFINIDWKASRHNRTLEANMRLLGKTIAGIVRNMNPTMICMCEVGEASKPLPEEQMQQVADQSMQAWKEAATEHFELRSMFEVGAPYMTIYKDGPIRCS